MVPYPDERFGFSSRESNTQAYVDRVNIVDNQLRFLFGPSLPASYSGVLCVGERSFPFDRSDYNSQATAIAFSNHGLSWVDGQRVELPLWEVPSKQGDWASLCLPPPPLTVSIQPGQGDHTGGRGRSVPAPRQPYPHGGPPGSGVVSTDGDFGADSGVRRVGIRRGTNRTYHQFQTTDDDTDEANGSITADPPPTVRSTCRCTCESPRRAATASRAGGCS